MSAKSDSTLRLFLRLSLEIGASSESSMSSYIVHKIRIQRRAFHSDLHRHEICETAFLALWTLLGVGILIGWVI